MSLTERLSVWQSRGDPHAFLSFAAKDETSGEQLVPNAFHKQLAHLIAGTSGVSRFTACAHTEAGKSTVLLWTLVWLLGRHPNLRIGVACRTTAQAQKIIRAVQQAIEHSKEVRLVFPQLKPGSIWRQDALRVAVAPAGMRDPNLQALTPDASGFIGSRLDLVICDDLDDVQTTGSPAARAAQWAWLVGVVLARLTPNGRAGILSTAWHREDALHRFAANVPNCASITQPVLDQKGNSTWPERWPLDRIEARRRELGPIAFRRLMMCEAIADGTQLFPANDIEQCVALAHQDASFSRSTKPSGRYILGIDPSTGQGADHTGLCLVCVRDSDDSATALYPMEAWMPPPPRDDTREVVQCVKIKGDLHYLTEVIVMLANGYGATCWVESNGVGAFLIDNLKKHVPVRGIATTSNNKVARAEWLSAEMAAGRWRFPFWRGEGIKDLTDALSVQTADQHLDDAVSALLIALEGVRSIDAKRGRGHVERFHFSRGNPGRPMFIPVRHNNVRVHPSRWSMSA